MRLWLIAFTLVFTGACVHQSPRKEWNAHDYKNNSNSQLIAAHRAMTRITLKGNERILDVGCGDGKITAEIAAGLAQGFVHGVDLSDAMINFASNNFADRKNLQFSQMDAASLRFKDEFDVVVSFSALQWVPDQNRAFKSVYRSLKERGTFLMMIPVGYPDTLARSLDDMMNDEEWRGYFAKFRLGQVFHTKDQYERMLRDQGFVDVTVELVPAFDRFQNIEAFKNFVRQWLPHLGAIPKEKHDVFMTELMNRYEMNQGYDADGSIWFNKLSLEAVAKKG